jgi:hypothetical protein
MKNSVDTLADLEAQLAEVESRLVDDYGADCRTTVHRMVEEERHRFDNARIHVFVPILVERSVRSRFS